MKKGFFPVAVWWTLAISVCGCGSSGDHTPPTVPTGLQAAVVSSDSVQLNWTASRDDLFISGYRVYRNGTRVGSTPLTTYTDTGLSPGNTYGYRVSALDWIGNESEKSTTLFVATADESAPTAPANLQGTAVSASRIDLAWTASTDNVGVTGYRIYRDGAVIGTTAGTSYSDTGLAEYTTYVYRVAACDAGGNESAPSSPLTATTVDATAPSVPSNLQGAAASTSRIDLTWTASTDNVGVTGYRVYRNGSQVGTTASTSYSDAGLSEYTSYSYTVAAYDASGNVSSQCGAVAVSTLDGTAPSVPADLQATVVSTSRIDLTWTASTDNVGVAGYRVYRDGSLVASPAGTSYSDTGLSAGTTYSYRVAAYDAAGNASAQSGAVNATTQSGTWGGTVLIGTASNDRGQGIAVDTSGNIYVAGHTAGDLDGESNANPGTHDIFLTKYDPSGTRQWTRLSGTTGGDESGWSAVAVDGSGNIYVTGYTSGNLDGETNAGGSDAVLIKYNSSGTRQWTRLLGSAASDSAWSVGVDGSGNVYISGFTAGSLGDQTNSGGTDAFLAKYNPSGTLQWVRQLGNATLTYSYAVAVASSGNAYISGMTRGSLDGETNVGIQDIFVAKYNSSGARQWTRMLGSAVFDYCYSVAVDASENVYVAGDSYGHFDGWSNTDVSGTTEDLFLAKFNASGTKQWSVFHGGTGNDVASGLAVDSSGNAYISGNTNAALDGFTPAGSHDLILIKYDTSGTRQWTSMLGTTAGDYARSVAVDGSGNTYMTGNTSENLDGASNAGGNDGFIVKHDTSGNLQ